MAKKFLFKEIKEKFIEQGRIDIEICEDGFEGWKKKSKFYDKVVKKYFFSVPKRVFEKNGVHPERSKQRKRQTNLKKYGNVCSLHGNTVEAKKIHRKKTKTCIEKYGVEHPSQSEDIKNRKKVTCLEKYGVDNISKSERIKKKKIKTSFERYNVSHPMLVSSVKEKLKTTNKEKYGVEHPSQSPIIKNKKKETLQRKHGVSSPFQLPGVNNKSKDTHEKKYGTKTFWESKKLFTVNSDGLLIAINDWWASLPEPKISYSHLCTQITKNPIEISDLHLILLAWKQNKTVLESTAEILLEQPHYNKKPKQLIECSYRPDFKLSEQIFVNVDGLYWHSEQQKEKRYHFGMREKFENSGIRIIQFHENEIYHKSNIVKSMVQHACKQTINKIGARNCSIRKVSQNLATSFLKENHLMGTINAKHIGLFYNEKLVSILSYKSRKNIIKLERFCSQIYTQVTGGFTKLLKQLENHLLSSKITEIHNWVDLRYGTGQHLLQKGFVHSHDTLGWKWTDGENTYNRLRCRANMDHRKLSEKEHANELGLYRIYDAGQRLYIKTLIPSLESS